MAHGHYAKTLPNDLSAPAFVNAWRTRALIVGAVFAVLGIILALLANAQGDHWNHFFRAWLMGFMICFGFAVGGTGSAHGPVLLGRQVGIADPSPAGSDDPHHAAGRPSSFPSA